MGGTNPLSQPKLIHRQLNHGKTHTNTEIAFPSAAGDHPLLTDQADVFLNIILSIFIHLPAFQVP